MKVILKHPDLLFVQHVKTLLSHHEILSHVKNEQVQPIVGVDVWPELVVLREEDYERAKDVVAKALDGEVTQGEATWRCRSCRIDIEPQFTECWNCGASKV